MATRLYYRWDIPMFGPGLYTWDQGPYNAALGQYVHGLATSKAPSTLNVSNISAGSGASPRDILWWAHASYPLAAQTISGSVKGQIRALETSTSWDSASQMTIHLVDGSTGAIKSTLLDKYTGALSSEFAASTTNRKFPRGGSTALTTQVAAAGDRILVLIGCRTYAAGGPTISLAPWSVDQGDAAEDETSTTGDAWLEFSQTLNFLSTDLPGQFYAMEDAFDAVAEIIGDARAWYGEQTVSDVIHVPTELQIWPRGAGR